MNLKLNEYFLLRFLSVRGPGSTNGLTFSFEGTMVTPGAVKGTSAKESTQWYRYVFICCSHRDDEDDHENANI